KSFIGNSSLAEDRTILKIWRRGKLLGMDLAKNRLLAADNSQLVKKEKLRVNRKQLITLLFHLKMSGQLIWEGSRLKTVGSSKFIGGHPTRNMLDEMPNSHTRVIFSFSDGLHLYFNDQRKFGWVKIVQGSKLKIKSEEILGKLGPEPLKKTFTWKILKNNLMKHKSMPVKVAIMDQSVVAGVGNIYANEACFDAKIDPCTKVSSMSDKQFQKLYSGIVRVLKDGIKYGGSTRVHFVDPEGRKGYFLDYAHVYGKEGYPCKRSLRSGGFKDCFGKIKKITLGGRGTYLCPNCQK
ncbi:hypothetical protein KKE78_05080, partial [Patescibacteria group bacterium]|nr:hypothetical protein [Patescibacteria group bacterium]